MTKFKFCRPSFLLSIIHSLVLLLLPLLFLLLATSPPRRVMSNPDARRLYDNLLRKNKYNRLIRPVDNSSEPLVIDLSIKLSQIVDVEWRDHSLTWKPEEYGGVNMLYVPAESIWIPDIVLYNNADGDYIITLMTKATITSNGSVTWEPPAIYKTYCKIDVTYFPFDEQECRLKFGSWTYDGMSGVDLQHKWWISGTPAATVINPAMDLKEYYKSVEWDLMVTSANKNIVFYPCCEEPYPDVTFKLVIRRKTLYYTINLIIPCVSINMLTILAFYLPPDCGEKVSVCISILLSLSLFQLLLMELVPGTSLVTPLIGKYLLFTCVVVSMSVIGSVIVLNITHRSAATSKMPRYVDAIFLRFLPRLLCIESPPECSVIEATDVDFSLSYSELLPHGNPYKKNFIPTHASVDSIRDVYSVAAAAAAASTARGEQVNRSSCGVEGFGGGGSYNMAAVCEACARRSMQRYPPNVHRALDGIAFSANHTKSGDESRRVKDHWKYFSRVIDRLLLVTYISVCMLGGMLILLNAETLYDGKKPLTDGVQ